MNFAEDVAEKQRGVTPEVLNQEFEKFREKFKLDEKDIEKLSVEQSAMNYEQYREKMMKEFDLDASKFFVFGRDFT